MKPASETSISEDRMYSMSKSDSQPTCGLCNGQGNAKDLILEILLLRELAYSIKASILAKTKLLSIRGLKRIPVLSFQLFFFILLGVLLSQENLIFFSLPMTNFTAEVFHLKDINENMFGYGNHNNLTGLRYMQLQCTELLCTSKRLDRFNWSLKLTSLEWWFFKWNRKLNFEKKNRTVHL